jgi:hypothetical protein
MADQIWGEPRRSIGGMNPRPIITVLVTVIVLLAVALFVLTRTGSDGDAAADVDTTTTTSSSSTSSTTSSTSTTTTTTTIPTACRIDAAGTAVPAAADQPSPAPPSKSALNESSSVSTVGLDEVTFGMTVVQAETAANTRMVLCEPVSDCYRITPFEAPEGIRFVVNAGTIERVDIVGGPITTRSGIGIGTPQERVVELFGDRIETRVNDDSSVDLVFVPQDDGDDQFRVIFTIREGSVDTYRSGRIPLVFDLDPCAT